jgi:CRP/FNR family transcriptional regulator, cyclic AMP receptor protein
MTEEVSAKIENFFSRYTLKKLPKGQILILHDEDTHYIYHLTKGNIKEYDVTYRGDEIILNIFKPPAFFPMYVAINKTHNLYTYEADTDVELRQAPAEEVIRFVKTNPDVLYDLLSRVYRGVDGLLGRMVHLMASSAKSRLMYELLIEAKRFGDIKANGSCFLNQTEKNFGARAGLSRETVSREMKMLKAQGLVEIKNKGIFIKNVAELEKKLGQEV